MTIKSDTHVQPESNYKPLSLRRGPKIQFWSLHSDNSILNFKFKSVETRNTTFVSITPMNFLSTQSIFKNMPGTDREQIHALETLYVAISTFYLAFNCRPQTNMLFFKFIWLDRGFRETWKFSFKTKTLGSSGCRYNYSSNHNRVVREQTWSCPALCMIRLIRGNLTADNAFQKQKLWFCSQILQWPPKILIFQVANKVDIMYVFLERMNPLSLWHYHLTSE